MDAPVILTSLCNETPVHLNMETKTKIQSLYGERRARKNKIKWKKIDYENRVLSAIH